MALTSWLVTGGAGYVGAHVVMALRERGESAVVLDDLSTGTTAGLSGVPVVVGSVLDADLVRRTVENYQVRGIVHLAAKKRVTESIERPLFYYRQNLLGTLTVLEAAKSCGVASLLFSSSASVYGAPDADFVTEETATRPMSPYGETKLVGEWMSSAASRASDLRVVTLRYFNVAGTASTALADRGSFNLIPLAIGALAAGNRPRIFGVDYPTPDGTCVRDYVHVADVADAHAAAAQYLDQGGPSRTYNVGRGYGSSVREVLAEIAAVTGIDLDAEEAGRRPGDPPRIVASAERIQRELGWTAKHDLHKMIESAWAAWPRYTRSTQ